MEEMTDINKLIITRTTNGSASSDAPQKDFIFEEGEWYPMQITKIKKIRDTKYNRDVLLWITNVLGEEYVTEWNGMPQQLAIFHRTPTLFSPNGGKDGKPTKLYEFVCKIVGRKIDVEAEEFDFNSLIGKQFEAIIATNEVIGNDGVPKKFFNIAMVRAMKKLAEAKKPAPVQAQPAPVQQPVKKPVPVATVAKPAPKPTPVQNPDGAISPEDIQFDPTQTTAEEDEMFKGVI